MTNLKTDVELTSQKTSYDDLPYANYSFSYASPEHIYTIAKIFGLNPAPVETAKVLDLGCGFGGNIIGFAGRYPKSHSVGVDLSKTQIDDGKKMVGALGLDNIDLKHISIGDIDDSIGKFDYIICHGVFSWVPKEIQDKILEVIQKQLAPSGVAYVSYNTLPGWNIVSTFREMLQYHTDAFSDIRDKLTQARAFISFLKEGLAESNTPYYKFLESEADIISSEGDSYLRHEYLERGNTQFYFNEFINMAAAHDLTYLADTHLPNMYIGNLPEKAIEKLGDITDIVRVEQYMDFVTNRRFRNTILCRNGSKINRNIDGSVLDDMWMSMGILGDVPADQLDFTNPGLKASFAVDISGNKAKCEINGAPMCAALYAFIDANGAYISMSDVVQYIKSRVPSFSEKDHLKIIQAELIALLFKGALFVRKVKPLTVNKISEKPAISKLALIQIANNFPLVSSQLNDSIGIQGMYRIVMIHLDGTNNIDQIVNKVSNMLRDSKQDIQIEGKTVTDETQKLELIKNIVNNTLQFCLSYGFLVG